MADQKRHAIYLAHRRSEHDYREWIIMPATDRISMNVWSRYIDKDGARPVWRGTKYGPTADAETRNLRTMHALNGIASTLSGHYRQNDRNPGGKQWTWDTPVVVEVTDSEVLKHWNTTPYPALNRIKRVLAHRKQAGAAGMTPKYPSAEAMLTRLAQLLEPVS